MATDLFRALSDFQPFEDRETANAFFRRHVPELGSAAYLHVIYKPVDQHLLDETGKRLKIPEAFLNFLKRQNGASLFSNTLHIFGVVPKGQMVNRTDPFSLPPFNLEKENSHLSAIDQERFLAFGGYGFDGSTLCIDRSSNQVQLFPRDDSRVLVGWPEFEEWIGSEIERLRGMFSTDGRLLVTGADTVPYVRLRAI